MKNTYLINDGYYIRYIKEDLSSLLLFYKYFYTDLFLPKYLNFTLIRKVFNKIILILIPLIYISKIYKIKYKTVLIDDEAIIILKGKGAWASTIKLVKIEDKFKIIKKLPNEKSYLKEKKFYETYKNNPSDIKLPKHKFVGNNTIEIDFLKTKSFQKLIIDGSYNLGKSLEQYEKIKKEIDLFYGKNTTLIHGDLWLTNIFISGDTYYLIDFSDSQINNPHYDLLILLYSILTTFQLINPNERKIGKLMINNMPITSIIGINYKKVSYLEEKFHAFRKKKLPNIYN